MIGPTRRIVRPGLSWRTVPAVRHASSQSPGFPREPDSPPIPRDRAPYTSNFEEEEDGEDDDGPDLPNVLHPEVPESPVPSRGFLQPEPLPKTHNHPVALLHFRSYYTDLLGIFTHFALHTAVSLGIPTSGVASLPTQRSMWTVLKSPFAHKKAQENFERKTHKRAIKVFDADPEVLETYVAYLEQHALGGVGMRVTRWTRAQVGVGREMWEGMARAGQGWVPQQREGQRRIAAGEKGEGEELWEKMVGEAGSTRTQVEEMARRIVEVEMAALAQPQPASSSAPPPPSPAPEPTSSVSTVRSTSPAPAPAPSTPAPTPTAPFTSPSTPAPRPTPPLSAQHLSPTSPSLTRIYPAPSPQPPPPSSVDEILHTRSPPSPAEPTLRTTRPPTPVPVPPSSLRPTEPALHPTAPRSPEAALAAALHPVRPVPQTPGPSTAGPAALDLDDGFEEAAGEAAGEPSTAGVDVWTEVEDITLDSLPEDYLYPEPSTAGPPAVELDTSYAEVEPSDVDPSTAGLAPSVEPSEPVVEVAEPDPSTAGLDSPAEVDEITVESSPVAHSEVDPSTAGPALVDSSAEPAAVLELEDVDPSTAGADFLAEVEDVTLEGEVGEKAYPEPSTAGLAAVDAEPPTSAQLETEIIDPSTAGTTSPSQELEASTTTEEATDVDPSTAGVDNPAEVEEVTVESPPEAHPYPEPRTAGLAGVDAEGPTAAGVEVEADDVDPSTAGVAEPSSSRVGDELTVGEPSAEGTTLDSSITTTTGSGGIAPATVYLDVREDQPSTAGTISDPAPDGQETTASPSSEPAASADSTSSFVPSEVSPPVDAAPTESAQPTPVSPEGTETEAEVLARDEPISGGSAVDEMPQSEHADPRPVSPEGTETQTEVLARDEPIDGSSAVDEMPQEPEPALAEEAEVEVVKRKRGRPKKVVEGEQGEEGKQ